MFGGRMAVVSVKIPDEVKSEMERFSDRICWSDEIRSFIVQKLEEARRHETMERVEALLRTMPTHPEGTAAKLVREIRDSD